jgi:uncharacterized protein YlbG (UPF0298 family)
MKRLTIFFLLMVLFSCSREDKALPSFEESGSLYIWWQYGNDIKDFRVGQNALSARSFVAENQNNQNRKFIFQYIIDAEKQIDVIFSSKIYITSTASIESDMLNTLQVGNDFIFDEGGDLEPGSVSIVYHDKKDSYFSSSLANQNTQTAVFKIINSKLIKRNDGTQYLEIDFEFNCAMHHNTENVVIKCDNGSGKLAFRLLQ